MRKNPNVLKMYITDTWNSCIWNADWNNSWSPVQAWNLPAFLSLLLSSVDNCEEDLHGKHEQYENDSQSLR